MNKKPMQHRVAQLDETALNIYTDGSCLPTPRRGGVGLLFATVGPSGQQVITEEPIAGWMGATNNEMELQACIEALRVVLGRRRPFDLSNFSKIVIFTDSMYVYESFDQAKFEWPKNRWRTRGGSPVLHTDQWKELIRLVKKLDQEFRLRVKIEWVKGHKNDQLNKRVDKLAKESARSPSNRTIKVQHVRKRTGPNRIEPGSVKLEGQIEDIRILNVRYLRPPHKLYHCAYEVIRPQSPNLNAADKAFSQAPLSAGHSYRVRFNDSMANPRIAEVIEELLPDHSGPDEGKG